MAKLLIVEDDSNLADSVVDMLKSENHYSGACPQSAADAANLLAVSAYDAIVLDLGLPDKDGIEVLKEYRGRGGKGKILILTGRGKVEEKELGLDLGADDYLTKPFHVKELAARVRALLMASPEGVVTGGFENRHIRAKTQKHSRLPKAVLKHRLTETRILLRNS